MSQKKSMEPLLYIYQPFSRPPANLNMQDVYREKKQGAVFDDTIQNDQMEESLIPKQSFDDELEVNNINLEQTTEEAIEQPIEQTTTAEQTIPTEQTLVKDPSPSFNRVKPFKEMNLTERLDYLLNFPKVLPPVPCIFYTNTQKLQGYLTAYEDNIVTIQLSNKSLKTFAVEELTNVVMMGLKR